MNPRKKPSFVRRQARWLKKLGEKWRKSRGLQAKQRLQMKGKPAVPSIGWRAPKELRGLHPSGYREVLVHSPKELERIDEKSEVVRIASRVGKRKRKLILERAKQLGVRVLNP
jgi:large subunit ribosomal protein L32e